MDWNLDPVWIPLSEINGGKQYEGGDGICAADLNAVIENVQALYRKHFENTYVTIGTVQTVTLEPGQPASVTITPRQDQGLTVYLDFLFEIPKGEKGDPGEGAEGFLDGTLIAKKAEQDAEGNNIADTYAKKTEIPDVPDVPMPSASDNGDLLGVSNGAYALIDPSSLTVGNATNAVNATNDGNGDNIADTYQPRVSGVAPTINGIELGDQSSAAPAYIDFHTDGTSSDFNARILAEANSNDLKVEVPAGGAFRVPSDQDYLPNGDVSNKAVSTQFLQPQTMFYNINGGNSVNLGYRGKSYSTIFNTSEFTTTESGNVHVVRSGNVITVGGWLKNRLPMYNGTAYTLIQGLPKAVGDSYGEATFASMNGMCRVYINTSLKNIVITPSHLIDTTTISANSWFSFSITYITNE